MSDNSPGYLYSFSSALTKETLLVERFSGVEHISDVYQFQIELCATTDTLDFGKILAKPALLSMALANHQQRYWHGLVSRCTQIGGEGNRYRYALELVPWLWLLKQTMDNRIFQQKSVPEIIEAVFQARGLHDYKLTLTKKYTTRSYCVQYHESDFSFVSRLMEEEGIFYYFEHQRDKHILILGDDSSTALTCPLQANFSYYTPTQATMDVISEWHPSITIVPSKVSLSDYNFEQPSNDLLISVPSVLSKYQQDSIDCYEYPGNFGQLSTGEAYAKLHMQTWETQQTRIHGQSGCAPLTAGYTFTLARHFRTDYNGDYFLLSVAHQGVNNLPDSMHHSHYENHFVCQPKKIVFRPPRVTAKPVIYGVQTAIVVGPQDEEIYTDQYGRVKIQFFWDRLGKKNDQSSGWVRVAQRIAGVNWGELQIPRVGQEVIVNFIEGNPDNPVIMGNVYNAHKMPPYDLPSNKTMSGLKTRSTPKGSAENFNELRFEDKKGEEDVYFQAEKDFHRLVKNNDDLKVAGDQNEVIQKNRIVILEQGSDQLTIKKGDMTISVSAGKSTTEAMQSIELKVGQSSVKIDQSGVTIQGLNIQINGKVQTKIQALKVDVESDGMLTLKGGVTMIN